MSLALPGEKANKIVEQCLEAFFAQESWRWGLLHDYSAAYPRAFRQFFGTAVLSKEKPRSSLVSPICTYRKMSSKGSCIRGHSSSDRPCVENAILVPTSVRTQGKTPVVLEFLRLCHDQYHPMWKTLQLAAWKLSGNPYQQEVFRSKCPLSSYHPGAMALMPSSIQHGTDGVAGVFNTKSILFEHL